MVEARTTANAPLYLDTIKDDLGIPATDTTHDEWLQRRINGVWSRMENYTSRKLCAPPATFQDDWSEIAVTNPYHPLPPVLWRPAIATVFLRYCPVASIEAIEFNGTAGVAEAVRFDPKTGKLFTLRDEWATDVSRELIGGAVKVTYRAGWDEIPGDLYEVALGAIQVAWNGRQGQGAGLPGSVSSINLIDVGSVEVAAGNPFVVGAGTTAPAAGADPLLGPWVNILDLYIDHRSRIGHAMMPTTRQVASTTTGGDGSTAIGELPPLDPFDGQLWWNNSTGPGGGQLYVYYYDGTSRQWVPASALAVPP